MSDENKTTKRGRKSPAEPTQLATAETTPEELLAIVEGTLKEGETAELLLSGNVHINR